MQPLINMQSPGFEFVPVYSELFNKQPQTHPIPQCILFWLKIVGILWHESSGINYKIINGLLSVLRYVLGEHMKLLVLYIKEAQNWKFYKVKRKIFWIVELISNPVFYC